MKDLDGICKRLLARAASTDLLAVVEGQLAIVDIWPLYVLRYIGCCSRVTSEDARAAVTSEDVIVRAVVT